MQNAAAALTKEAAHVDLLHARNDFRSGLLCPRCKGHRTNQPQMVNLWAAGSQGTTGCKQQPTLIMAFKGSMVVLPDRGCLLWCLGAEVTTNVVQHHRSTTVNKIIHSPAAYISNTPHTCGAHKNHLRHPCCTHLPPQLLPWFQPPCPPHPPP